MAYSPELIQQRLAEAARYALLRRLAPAIRHDMAGALQPISMMAAMLDKRLQKPDPDMAALGKNASAINTLAREASNGCMSLMTWLAPKDNAVVPLAAAVADAISLVSTELSFRGFTLVNETGAVQDELPRSMVRGAFMAALLALTDSAPGPARVVLTARADGHEVVLVIAREPDTGDILAPGTQAYRLLDWADVEAIAETESVKLSHGPDHVELRYRVP